MVTRRYSCLDCENDFQLPPDDEPRCPSCDSRSVTFEGKVQAPIWYRIWERVRPVFNFFLLPWRFFQGRGIPRAVGLFLITVLYVGMFAAHFQAKPAMDQSSKLGKPGHFYLLRAPDVLLNDAGSIAQPTPDVEKGRPGEEERTGTSLNQLGFLFGLGLVLEWYWAGMLLILLGWDKFRDVKAQLAAVLAGSLWIPNMILAAGQIVYFRGLQYDFWTASPAISWPMIHLGAAAVFAYVLVGGLGSIDIRFSQYLTRLVLTLLVQVVGVFTILYLSKVYLFPRMGLAVGATGRGIFIDAMRFCLWPFVG
jgi:DNA-directed RNA polymerase subunit RPC12/RpoP